MNQPEDLTMYIQVQDQPVTIKFSDHVADTIREFNKTCRELTIDSDPVFLAVCPPDFWGVRAVPLGDNIFCCRWESPLGEDGYWRISNSDMVIEEYMSIAKMYVLYKNNLLGPDVDYIQPTIQ